MAGPLHVARTVEFTSPGGSAVLQSVCAHADAHMCTHGCSSVSLSSKHLWPAHAALLFIADGKSKKTAFGSVVHTKSQLRVQDHYDVQCAFPGYPKDTTIEVKLYEHTGTEVPFLGGAGSNKVKAISRYAGTRPLCVHSMAKGLCGDSG